MHEEKMPASNSLYYNVGKKSMRNREEEQDTEEEEEKEHIDQLQLLPRKFSPTK